MRSKIIWLTTAFLSLLLIYKYSSYVEGFGRTSIENEIRLFSFVIRRYIADTNNAPGNSLNETVENIRNWKEKNPLDAVNNFPMIEKNRDAWGEPFIYEISKSGDVVTLRSKGENRVDDHGNNDDIEEKINVLRVQP